MRSVIILMIFFLVTSFVVSANSSSSSACVFQPQANLTFDKAQFAAVNFRGSIYAIGGRNYTYNSVNTVLTYNKNVGAWSSAPNLARERCNHAAVIYQDEIWVIGGYDWGSEILASVEIFNGTTWRYGPNLTRGRQELAAAVGDNRIFATGGLGDTYEIYDPTSKSWTQSPVPLPAPLSGHASVGSLDGKSIYIYGGYNGSAYTNLAYVLDISNQIWKTLSPMTVTRWALAGVVGLDNGLIYAIGGMDGGTNVWTKIEAFDASTGTWSSKDLPELLYPRYSLAASMDNDGLLYAVGGYGIEFNDPIHYVESWDSRCSQKILKSIAETL